MLKRSSHNWLLAGEQEKDAVFFRGLAGHWEFDHAPGSIWAAQIGLTFLRG